MSTCVDTLKVSDKVEGTCHGTIFHTSGKFFVTCSSACEVKFWSFDSSKKSAAICLEALKRHKGTVKSAAFNSKGTILATGSSDNTVILWEISISPEDNLKVTFLVTLEGHYDSVTSVAFDSTGCFLVTGSHDKTVRLLCLSPDVSAAECVATLQEHGSVVTSVAFHPTEPLLATGSDDMTVRLWR